MRWNVIKNDFSFTNLEISFNSQQNNFFCEVNPIPFSEVLHVAPISEGLVYNPPQPLFVAGQSPFKLLEPFSQIFHENPYHFHIAFVKSVVFSQGFYKNL